MSQIEREWDAQGEALGNVPREQRRGRRLAQRLGISKDFVFDYKDIDKLRYFITDRGKLVPRRISGLSARQQRSITQAVKRARAIALLPYTSPSA
jgi:small subunit ribosomal protein S18